MTNFFLTLHVDSFSEDLVEREGDVYFRQIVWFFKNKTPGGPFLDL